MTDLARRKFLAGSTVLAGGLALGVGCSGSDTDSGADEGDAGSDTGETSNTADATTTSAAQGSATSDGAPFDPSDWESVRAQFPLNDRAHFEAYVLASHPRPVAEAIERHRAGLDEDTERYLVQAETEDLLEPAVRSAAAEYLAAQPEEIALTDSTTMGLGLLYAGIRIRPDQQIVTTEHDFYSTHQALALRSVHDGATVERVALYDDPAEATADDMVSRLMGAVTPSTRVVAVTWVHSGTGVKLPIRAIADALAEANADRSPEGRALLCVDGVHGLGVEDVTAADLGCDFLISGTHKWLFGPRGTGIIWGSTKAWGQVDAAIPAFEPQSFREWIGQEPPGPMDGIRFSPGGYHSFEHRWAVTEAFQFHLDIGKDRIATYTHEQATQLKEGLASLRDVTLVTPVAKDLSSGIVCFEVAGTQPPDILGRLLEADVVATITPYRDQYVRVGPSMVTSPDQVDTLLEALDA